MRIVSLLPQRHRDRFANLARKPSSSAWLTAAVCFRSEISRPTSVCHPRSDERVTVFLIYSHERMEAPL